MRKLTAQDIAMENFYENWPCEEPINRDVEKPSKMDVFATHHHRANRAH